MVYFLMLLGASVFLGSKILAVSTPLAQMTIYRLCTLCVIPLIIYQLKIKQDRLRLLPNSSATLAMKVLGFWWLWAIASFAWVQDIKGWFQAVFLLSLGVLVVVALYLWIDSLTDWLKVLKAMWLMMTLLMGWGYFEILTGRYYLADLVKLDKYKTFTALPSTRIPITTFANQNDYATMLLAYMTICLIFLVLARHWFTMALQVGCLILTTYLIYRSGSRMSLLCALILLGLQLLRVLVLKLSRRQWLYLLGGGLLLMGVFLTVFTGIRSKLLGLIYLGGANRDFSGDMVRLNLWRNGLLFLGQTLGLGVGAGNIEYWMANDAFLPVEDIVNMHNWWLEILVAYGAIVWVAYLVSYGALMARLRRQALGCMTRYNQVANILFAYLCVFILASITSANNMLIEWHWLFYGMIISYIKVGDLTLTNGSELK